MTMKFQTAAALALMLFAAPAWAEEGDLNASIEDTLDSLQTTIEEARLWKFHVRPSFSQSVIWTDNVYLNDSGEQPFTLTSVITSNGNVITNKQALNAIENTVPDFKDLQSEGRVQDTIFKSNLDLGLVLPINDEMTKLFQVNELNVLSGYVTNYNYVNENDLDATDYGFKSDVFGFLDDLLSYSGGNKIWVRAKLNYEKVSEPLDTDIVELQQIGILRVDFLEFERKEYEGDLDIGFREGKFDGFVGGSWFRRRLKDEELRQAEYDRYELRVQVGMELPWFAQKHGYVRYDFNWYRPEDRAVDGDTQALNDGDYYRIVAGVDGALGSEKISGRAEVGYASWDPNDSSGISGDDSSFNAVVGLLEASYKPWENERNTKFQLSYEHLADASAISNYNKIHRGTLTVTQTLIPGQIDGDVSFGVNRTTASEGPYSTLYDFGVGAVYHWFDQVDVSLRYVYRNSSSHNEIKIISSFDRGGNTFNFTSESDGDFYSHTVQVGLDIKF